MAKFILHKAKFGVYPSNPYVLDVHDTKVAIIKSIEEGDVKTTPLNIKLSWKVRGKRVGVKNARKLRETKNATYTREVDSNKSYLDLVKIRADLNTCVAFTQGFSKSQAVKYLVDFDKVYSVHILKLKGEADMAREAAEKLEKSKRAALILKQAQEQLQREKQKAIEQETRKLQDKKAKALREKKYKINQSFSNSFKNENLELIAEVSVLISKLKKTSSRNTYAYKLENCTTTNEIYSLKSFVGALLS